MDDTINNNQDNQDITTSQQSDHTVDDTKGLDTSTPKDTTDNPRSQANQQIPQATGQDSDDTPKAYSEAGKMDYQTFKEEEEARGVKVGTTGGDTAGNAVETVTGKTDKEGQSVGIVDDEI